MALVEVITLHVLNMKLRIELATDLSQVCATASRTSISVTRCDLEFDAKDVNIWRRTPTSGETRRYLEKDAGVGIEFDSQMRRTSSSYQLQRA
jgi:hypothetical protein